MVKRIPEEVNQKEKAKGISKNTETPGIRSDHHRVVGRRAWRGGRSIILGFYFKRDQWVVLLNILTLKHKHHSAEHSYIGIVPLFKEGRYLIQKRKLQEKAVSVKFQTGQAKSCSNHSSEEKGDF